MDRAIFIARLKALRKKSGMTQEELADKINIPFDTVKKWENAKHGVTPGADGLLRLCDVFNCDLEYLFGEQEYPRKSIQEVAEKSGIDYDAIMSFSSFSAEASYVLRLLLNAEGENGKTVFEELLSELWRKAIETNAFFSRVPYANSIGRAGRTIEDIRATLQNHKKRFMQEGNYDKAYGIILDAARKGLPVESEVIDAFAEYRQAQKKKI